MAQSEGNSRSYLEEPPETPAHLFAVRAFKTALFGTPAPRRENVKTKAAAPTTKLPPKETQRPESFPSPNKGILLTPGTAASRRKTVSFGEVELSQKITEALQAEPKVGSPKKAELSANPSQGVRRSLFRLPQKTEPEVSTEQSVLSQDGAIDLTASNTLKNTSELESASNADVTVDLQNPRSKSGQHWKKEYQRDHDNSKLEMKKLIRHSQMAKSYAIKRDQEAISLKEKLNHAEDRVKEMEQKVSELASELAAARLQDGDQERLIEELAAQTTQSLRYKQKAERYKIALREQEHDSRKGDTKGGAPRGEFASEGFEETAKLRAEITALRKAAEEAERKAQLMESKNSHLTSKLQRVKIEMTNYGARHKVWETAKKENEGKLLAKIETLKQKLAESKEENARLTGEPNPGVAISSRSSRSVSASHGAKETGRSSEAQSARQRRSSAQVPIFEEPGKDSDAQREKTLRRAVKHGLRDHGNARLNRISRSAEIDVDAPESDVDLMAIASKVSQSKPISRRSGESVRPSRDAVSGFSNDVFGSGPQRPGGLGFISSRSSSLAKRSPLPADRLAAAKRRLEEKQAEKQRRRLAGKENLAPFV